MVHQVFRGQQVDQAEHRKGVRANRTKPRYGVPWELHRMKCTTHVGDGAGRLMQVTRGSGRRGVETGSGDLGVDTGVFVRGGWESTAGHVEALTFPAETVCQLRGNSTDGG